MGEERPGSVVAAGWLLVVMLVVYGVASLLTVVLDDELVDSWAAGRADTGSVKPPSFVAVAVVMFVVLASLTLVLTSFFLARLAWARVLLSVVIVMMVIGSLALVRTGPPTVFLVFLLVGLAVDAAALVALWHRDTSVFLAGPAGRARSSGRAED